MKRAWAGEPIPEGWAFAEGKPTTDPAAALTGTMAPAGGYKGVGAALMVEVFAACLGDDTGALVNDEARAALAVRDGERPGIGAERRLPSAPGRDRGGRVGEAERDHARLRQALRMIAQNAAIIGIADREARDAIGHGGGDQRGQTKVDGGMGEARTRIDDKACRRRSR
jgi:hypothetical protein